MESTYLRIVPYPPGPSGFPLAEPSEYDKHSIGSYFKLCDSLKSTLKTRGNFHNYSLNFNMGEVGTGFAVLAVFAIVITLGVIYG